MPARPVARVMHLALAPGETLLPGTREAIGEIFAREDVEAVLMPLLPLGDALLPRAARRYLASWDGRFLHAQNFFAPATRAAFRRAPAPGPRNADAAPRLADALAQGRRIEALREGGVATRIADDLGAWSAHFRAEGAAWGALAAREARFAGFSPAPWAQHVVRQAPRRLVEVAQATRRPDALVWLLHVLRESAFCHGGASWGRSREPSRRQAGE